MEFGVGTNIMDLIPSKYERHMSNNNMILKYISFVIMAIVFTIFFGTMQLIHQQFDSILAIVNFVFIVVFFILNVFWLYYKLQHIIIGTYKIFMDLNIIYTNSKYYSGLEIPNICVNHLTFPDITIQLPVYKESLENTIKPTIMSAIIQAERYTLETGHTCNIIVCDDGLHLISNEEKEKRLEFYRNKNIGITARPHPSKYKRNGRFKKAGNLNFSMNYCNCITDSAVAVSSPSTVSSPSPLNEFFKEMIELGSIFEGESTGTLCYGSYIFLIDSDTRFPDFSLSQLNPYRL